MCMQSASFSKVTGGKIYRNYPLSVELTYISNACGNCKRKDHAIRCSTGDLDWKAGDEEEDDFKDLMKTRSGRKTRAPVKYTM